MATVLALKRCLSLLPKVVAALELTANPLILVGLRVQSCDFMRARFRKMLILASRVRRQ